MHHRSNVFKSDYHLRVFLVSSLLKLAVNKRISGLEDGGMVCSVSSLF